ncbi:hypothetical protein [Sphingomonas astaxanthinifaciens]|uniref:Pentapeptide MXKDX repeat protein n=1 Tax=Sphingomonas astaxanthinifaciens DSM 22298 TaxID=1123267 RepID=A0ABQ5Z7S8_9SPHN|nr:hypothetical protein [Sphingomonas astaxanthinifaciens]GLR46839.1 hypothetical protein GCM10007925_05500 [Sphingomonas astaxanthinifaciens DSM 22298]
MRALILVAGAALSLAACGSKTEVDNADANLMTADNMSMDANMAAPMDSNMMGGADANMMTNGATEANMMAQDMNTNAPDTNLANGI